LPGKWLAISISASGASQVRVEMPGSISTIVLAQYADDDESKSNAADALAA
jgi:hypothetical protein